LSQVKFGDRPCQWCKHIEGTGSQKNTRCALGFGEVTLEEYFHGRNGCPNWKMPGKKKGK
jgi:hypothetical protein